MASYEGVIWHLASGEQLCKHVPCCYVCTIRVKRVPKLDLVNRRPLAASTLWNLPHLWSIYSSHTMSSPMLANAPPVVDDRRCPLRRFSSLRRHSDCAPGSASLASLGCHRFHLDLNCP